LWCIKEAEFKENLQNIRESQFSLGNGFLGTRGFLEEKPKGSLPGIYIAGVYDKFSAQVAELVNFPNPFYFKITAFGQKIGITAMDVVSHQRVLDMKNGTLNRHTVFSDNKKRSYDYQSLRFVSMADKNLGVMQVVFTPLDSDTTIQVQAGIDTSVYNSGTVTEGNKCHFLIKELSRKDGSDFLLVRTLEKKHYVIFRSGFHYKIGSKRKVFPEENTLTLDLKKGERVIFTKFFYADCCSKQDVSKKEKYSKNIFKKILRSNLHFLFTKHTEAFSDLWDNSDIIVEGTADIQKNVRFNIYHMLICKHYDNGFSSIGARTLSGEGYRGHIFWDVEIFLLPFYIHLFPEAAKNILLYRYKRLDKAKEIARAKGYKGVLFPWESAAEGIDETPTWAKNLDGSIIKIKTNEFEQHITADVAFACYNYFRVTDDKSFMQDYGYEIIFESARFWASRISSGKKGESHIKGVMGPDEFHEKVNNNAYTNIMARWNLLQGHEFYFSLKKETKIHTVLKNRLNLTDKEVRLWKYKALRLNVKVKKNKVIEQFDGFFRKKYIEIVNFDENNIPLLPKNIKVGDYNKTQFVKQADVLMAIYLLSDQFDMRTKESNFWFYLRRTLHKSSLSAPMHSLMAAEIGALSRSYQFFNVALRADISNLHGNTAEGIHAASLGGVWQCIVFGFAGVKIHRSLLSVNPCMPLAWSSISFSIFFKKYLLAFKVSNTEVRVQLSSKLRQKLPVKIFGEIHKLSPEKSYVFCIKEPVRRLPLAEKYY
jgi:kojibiose phosphorylase